MPPPTTIQRTTAMKLRLSIPGSGEPLSDVGTSVASNVLAHTSRGRGGGRSGGTAAPFMGRRRGVIQVRRHREHGGRQNPRSPPKEAKTSLGAHAAPSPAQGRTASRIETPDALPRLPAPEAHLSLQNRTVEP